MGKDFYFFTYVLEDTAFSKVSFSFILLYPDYVSFDIYKYIISCLSPQLLLQNS